MYKILGADGRQYGPASADDLRRYLSENRVNAQTLLLAEGGTEWKPLGTFAEFGGGLNAAPPPVIPLRPVGPPPASNKIAAGVCGILLGSLGVHKFILGYTGAGLIMLLTSVLSCFLLAPILSIIGLIEGIIYLSQSDEDFERTYAVNRKEWF